MQPLPGARELLAYLTENGIPWAIATSGRMETARPNIEHLGVDVDKAAVVTRDQVRYAKPDPDLFLEAARRINVPIQHCAVVGDLIWDLLAPRGAPARSASACLSGGYGQDELERAERLSGLRGSGGSC